MTTMTKDEALAQNERLESRLARWRRKSETAARRGIATLSTGAGGLAAGYIQSRWPVVKGTSLPTSVALGGVFIGIGVTDMAGRYSEEVLAFGNGMVAGGVALVSEPQFRELGAAA